LLGYAGLGATGIGMEPSDWMARVLRGRNLPLEQSLGVLTDAVNLRLPEHLDRLHPTLGSSHHILVPAIHNGEPKLFTIELVRIRGSNGYAFRYTRQVAREVPGGYTTPRFAVGGLGAPHLLRDKRWARDLLRLIKAHDAGRIKPQTVASAFARLNHRVSKIERTVGKRCIVVWRLPNGGGAHECFDGDDREPNFPLLPTIANGMEVSVLIAAVMPHMMPRIGEVRKVDEAAVFAVLAKLPVTPDDRLP
jgi:hypothetical protein